MACNLAQSIRLTDPSRPIALVIDETIRVDHRADLFAHLCVMPRADKFVGVLNKLRLYDASPFARSLFVDSDCLMMRASIGPYWAAFTQGCNTLGEKLSSGQWKGLDIKDLIREIGTDHLVKMNAGVIFFDKSALSKNIFRYMNDIFIEKSSRITTIHQKRPGQYSMEPILGAALAKFAVEPMQIQPMAGSLMVSTLDARHIRVSVDHGVAYLEKPQWRTPLRINLPGAAVWTPHSPIFLHFIGLKPKDIYRSVVARQTALWRALARGAAPSASTAP